METAAFVLTGGKTNGCVKGVGVDVVVGVGVGVGLGDGVTVPVGVGVGVRVAVAVAVADAVAVGVDVGVCIGVPVEVGVDVAVAVAVAVGVGVGLAVAYSIISTGGLVLSRVSNRFDVIVVDSSPNTSQPKLVAGLSSQDCTSAAIRTELQTYGPTWSTDWLALTVAEKSPPCVVQKMLS
jgi:hypothetical protein